MNLNRPGRRLIILLLLTSAVLTLIFWSFAGIPGELRGGAHSLSSHLHRPSSDQDIFSPFGLPEEEEDDDDDDDSSDDDGYEQHTPHMPGKSLSSQKTTLNIDPKVLTGSTIAPKLDNETAKAELGRAAWKLFHTTFARFPDKPSSDEQEALRAWILLFTRLYPCGECARHFQAILNKFPPQVVSRSVAAAWGCHVHNQVNESLDKELFDCSNIGDFYDCGCGDDADQKNLGKDDSKKLSSSETSGSGKGVHIPEDEQEPVELEKEDLQRGG